MIRLSDAHRILETSGKLPFLCSSLTNIRYLTGFAGSFAYLILMNNGKSVLITDTRYQEYAENLLGNNAEVVIMKDSIYKTISDVIGTSDVLFVEESSMTLDDYNKLKTEINTEIMPACGVIEKMRMIKDDNELSLIRSAVAITDQCAAFVAHSAHCGMTEWDLSVEIEHFYRKNSCRKSAFDSIVASGPDSSMPHYIPSMTKKIMKDAPLLVDMGAFRDEYNSDLTRTFFVSNISIELRKIYDIVLQAQLKAIAAVRPGITSGVLDSVARDYIAAEGYGQCFGHSLGHGVGLEIHEMPSIRRGGDIVLQKGMVITIEPGIYIPGVGGVRIEDMVAVTESGCEILTKYTKEPVII